MNRSFVKARKAIVKKIRKKPALLVIPVFITAFCIVLVYGLLNSYLHKDKTYSNLYIAGIHSGNLKPDEVVDKINDTLSQTRIKLDHAGRKEDKSATEFGIYADEQKLRGLAENKSFWSAFSPWFLKDSHELALYADSSKTQQVLKTFNNKDFKLPKNAKFVIENDKLTIKQHQTGFGLDNRKITEEIVRSLSVNLVSLSRNLEVAPIQPSLLTEDIKSLQPQIGSKLEKQYLIISEGGTVPATKEQIVRWLYVFKSKDGVAGLKINPDRVKLYVEDVAAQFSIKPINEITSIYKSGKKPAITTEGKKGRVVTNVNQVAEEIISSLEADEAYKGKFILAEADFKKVKTAVDDTVRKDSYTYDVAVWGSVKSDLASFKALAAQTLADSRGWSSGGVSFQEVPSGGNFTLVLAVPSRVASASPTCSSTYSCRVGRYVIINDDRWRLATPSWNNAGGSLRNYRHMVVNHETGHWLGFSHRFCGGSGQFAPVMQQQSISLQGCKFNPWPTAAEISSL